MKLSTKQRALTLIGATVVAAAVAVAPAGLSSAAAPDHAPVSAAPAQLPLPDNCSWTVSYDPWSWYRGYAGVCFTAEGLMWFDWNGGYGYVTDGGWF